MKAIRELRLTNTVWLAATLAILALGLAAVAWKWRNAHTPALKHGTGAKHHHLGVRSNVPETATAVRNNQLSQ
jgi:hypothetical protein